MKSATLEAHKSLKCHVYNEIGAWGCSWWVPSGPPENLKRNISLVVCFFFVVLRQNSIFFPRGVPGSFRVSPRASGALSLGLSKNRPNATDVVKSAMLRSQNHSNAMYIVKSAILEAHKSLKCYVYSEIGDSEVTQITQMLCI